MAVFASSRVLTFINLLFKHILKHKILLLQCICSNNYIYLSYICQVFHIILWVILINRINYKLVNILLFVIILFFIFQNMSIYKNIFSVIFPIFLSFFISYSLYPCVKYINKRFSYNVSCILLIVGILFVFSFLFYFSFSKIMNEVLYFKEDILYFLSKFSISFDKGMFLINKGTFVFSRVLLVCFLSIYFLFKMERFKSYLSKYPLFRLIDCDLFYYYKGFYLVIVFEIFEYFIIYLIIGHPYFLLLSFLSGVFSVVPFFGALFTNLLALITAYNISFKLFVLSSIVMIVVPIFNGYFLEPKIYNKTLNVSLFSVVLSCFVFASLFGVFGFVFAIPFFLILKNLFIFYFPKKDKV